MKRLLLVPILLISIYGFSQKIRLVEGNSDVLKGQTAINFEFVYDGVKVGKYATEQEYIDRKKADYNEKEKGKGDEWEKNWFADRKARFEPRFVESFTSAGWTSKSDAQYTIIFSTTFIEPGFNVGVMRRPAYMDGFAVLVATSDKSKVLAKYTVDNAPGQTFGGFDFDTGLRIQESYATAGKRLGRLIAKETGK